MNKVAHYLQQHLNGEILTSPEVLDYFSTDESILSIRPQLVVYPRSESDIRKTTRFTWQLAEKGRVVPITPRGMGTDMTGASLGEGIIMAMPAHMNKVIEFDSKTGVLTAESGISLDKLQQVLHTHGRFLPPVSSVNKYATLGGVVSNNDTGRSSYKYGPMQEFVRELRVVLANGELIETRRISKRELNKKLGLASFEGELYRSLDKIIEDNSDLVKSLAPITDVTPAGFDISDVKQKDGSFDLTPLFVGGQGTLGVITEITLDTVAYNPTTELIVAGFAERSEAWKSVTKINEMKEGPSNIDFVDISLIKMVQEINPGILSPLEGALPAVVLFINIDNQNQRLRKKTKKKIKKILESQNAEVVEPEKEEEDKWESIRDGASQFLTYSKAKKQAIPVLDDARIPLERMTEFFNELESLMDTASLQDFACWGQAGNGLVHVSPLLDISSVGDRQKLFKIMEAFYSYVCKIGGSISGEYAEGRTRGALLDKMFEPQAIKIFEIIKQSFDPYKNLNPGVKVNVNQDQIKPFIRNDYKLDHQYIHLPRG